MEHLHWEWERDPFFFFFFFAFPEANNEPEGFDACVFGLCEGEAFIDKSYRNLLFLFFFFFFKNGMGIKIKRSN